MKILIVGAGASGVVAGINYKRNHESDEVLIIEHLEQPLKKILASGNGKCNLGNSKIDFSLYNNPEFAKQIIDGYNYKDFFSSISIETKLNGDLAYPVSESAVSVKEALLLEGHKRGIEISYGEKLIDYSVNKQIEVITNKRKLVVDKLILAGGLKSSSKLGSDGSVLEILEKHGYKIRTPQPGLAPLFTKEKTKTIDGVRVKAIVSLISDGKLIHKENGEVLFKEHGLSGIVIFNTMSLISRHPEKNHKICLDLLPDFSEEYLKNYRKSHKFSELLLAFLNPKIANYLKDRFPNEGQLFASLKHLEFTFDKSYGFDFSQVSVGGVLVSEVNESLMSKHKNKVFIIGELLDIDGPCGGYNLTWAFASAIKSTK
jgi:hypothetical protein